MLWRLTRDVPGFVRRPLDLEGARRLVCLALDTRQQRFLDLVDRAVYGDERSPYRRLLAHAGCERGDLHALVAAEGVEGALRSLADRGVYVTFDELKGRSPIVRGSTRFAVADRDFDSPLVAGHLTTYTSGSGGRPTRVLRSLDLLTDGASTFSLALEAHGIRNPRTTLWLGGSPSWMVIYLKLGHPIDAWFYPIRPLPGLARLGARYLSALTGLGGRRLPPPVYCGLLEPETIAMWLADRVGHGRPVLLSTTTSAAVRVAVAASELGRSLAGVALHCRSEPLTAARRRLIERAGLQTVLDYGSMELPYVGFGCPATAGPDDVHLSRHLFAATVRRRRLFAGAPAVDALLLTSLSPAAAKVALNVELGDSARIEEKDCGCLLGELGLRTHLSEIRSFEKLSTEGTSFACSNVVEILEELLPARFGGSALDYQLVEEELAASGATRLSLRVHPAVGSLDEAAVRSTLLAALGRGGIVDTYQANLIRHAGSIVVVRRTPLATPAGKVLPFHLARRTGR